MPTNLHFLEPEELMAYVDGELTEDRAARVRGHVEQCTECREAAEDFRSLSTRLQDWPVEARDFVAPVLQPEFRKRSEHRWFRSAVVCCGVVALLVLVRISTWRSTLFLHESRREPSNVTTLSSPELQQNSFDLARGQAVPAARAFAPAPPVALARPVVQAPLIAQTARLALVAKDFASAEKSIDRILKQHHGYVAQMTLNAPTGAPHSLEASLRAPAAELESTMNDIKALGQVVSETRTGEEVTQQSIDLDARLASARNTAQRLTELLKQRTGKLSDVLAVEREIDGTQSEIERMEAERKNLTNRVTFASIDVNVSEQYEAPLAGTSAPWSTQLRNAAVQGFTSVEDTALDLLTFLLMRGPTLLLWFVILFLGFRLFWRRFGPSSLSWWKHDQ